MKSYFFTKVFAVVALMAYLVVSAQADEKIRVACVGDSITFGAGVQNRGENNYPKVLGGILGDKFEAMYYSLFDISMNSFSSLVV